MLFLAVTLGFIVENWRENLTNKQTEKQYMQSYIVDLQDDVNNMNNSLYQNQYLINGIDSLITAIYNYQSNDQVLIKQLYDLYVKYARSTYVMNFTDRTMSQLKSSGNLRLVNKEVSDSITRYDQAIAQYPKIQEAIYRLNWQRSLDLSVSIFDYKYLRYNITGAAAYLYPIGEYRLLTDDVITLSKYANLLELWRQLAYGYILDLQYQKNKALTLIPYLKKHYDIN